jgi:hypothetical protein
MGWGTSEIVATDLGAKSAAAGTARAACDGSSTAARRRASS